MADTRRQNLHITTDFSKLNGKLDSSSPSGPDTAGVGGFFEKATRLFTSGIAKPENVLPQAETWGVAIKKEQFQDMDLLESGHAREYIAEECLSPTQSKSWTYSTVERTNKTQYK
jgi:hypothetical protein